LTIVWELLWGLPQLNPYVLVTGLLAVSVLLAVCRREPQKGLLTVKMS
jgi:hypothetical protein